MTLKTGALACKTILAILLLAVPAIAGETPVLKTLQQKVSYGLGVDIAGNIRRQGIEADQDLVVKGLKDGLSGAKLLVPEEELHLIMRGLRHELNRRYILARKAEAEENEKKGKAFLAENTQKVGVTSLPSGLQYKVLKAGAGRKPTDTDTVECSYRSSLIDGTELDGSEVGKPAKFRITQIIPGWREALLLMPAGSRWQLFIPPELAYGEKGADDRIGPNATLIFEIELIAISDAPP